MSNRLNKADAKLLLQIAEMWFTFSGEEKEKRIMTDGFAVSGRDIAMSNFIMKVALEGPARGELMGVPVLITVAAVNAPPSPDGDRGDIHRWKRFREMFPAVKVPAGDG